MAEKKGFNLGDLLADVSELNTGREQIEYITLDLIDDDPNNFYRMDGLEALADNIAMCGLQQPIRVLQHPSDAGRYMIVSGHRRRAAVKLLAEENPEKWREIACIVEQDAVSPSLQQLRLIYANANTRAMTSAELSEQAVQVEKLLYQLKEEGYEFPGRMRDHVAKAVNASTTKLAKLKVIRENLAFCWQAAYKESTLAESTAYTLAQMPKSWQQLVFDRHGAKPKILYEESVKEYMRRFNDIAKVRCGDRGDIVCSHQVELMKKSCKDLCGNPCGYGDYCCLDCNSLQTCKQSCSHAAAKKKDLKVAAREENIKPMEEKVRREKPTIDFTREVWKRIGIAREASGVSVQEFYEAQQKYYTAAMDDARQKSMENGTAKIDVNTGLPFGCSFPASYGQRLCRVADTLNCSIDYLLGRSEDLRPAGGWQQGNPRNLGQYAVMIRWSKGSKITVEKMEWDGEHWRQFDADIEIFEDSEIFGWMELPEEVQQDA